VVVNLDLTVAVTHNFAEPRHLGAVRRELFQKLWTEDLLDEVRI
jgi:hypothetical protein